MFLGTHRLTRLSRPSAPVALGGALALALALMLAGAADAQALRGNKERKPIDVFVKGDRTVVEEEEARTADDEAVLVWQMKTAGFRFTANGIVFEAKGKHRCKTAGDGLSVRCSKLDHIPKQRFKYIVNVQRSSGAALDPLDPYIVND
jgi:intergrase/recombinase